MEMVHMPAPAVQAGDGDHDAPAVAGRRPEETPPQASVERLDESMRRFLQSPGEPRGGVRATR